MLARSAISAIVLICLVQAVALGQESEENPKQKKNSLHQSAWALQFQIRDNFVLSSFNGAVIAAKRHWSKQSAFRLGLSFDLSVSDADDVSSFQTDTLSSTQTFGDAEDRQSIQLDLQYLKYPNPNARVNVFFGGGPLARISRSNRESASAFGNEESLRTAWTVGGSVLLGAEWFVNESISFHGEYGVVVEYTRRTDRSVSRSADIRRERDRKTQSGRLDGRPFLFGLSIYF